MKRVSVLPSEVWTDGDNRPLQAVEITAMATTLATEGQLQPIRVTDLPAKSKAPAGAKYRLVFGHLRRAAAVEHHKQTGETMKLTADYMAKMSEEDIANARAVENMNRQALDPMQEAQAIALMDANAPEKVIRAGLGLDPKAVLEEYDRVQYLARTLGRSPKWVADRYFLTRLAPGIQAAVAGGGISLPYARLLARLDDPKDQQRFADECQADDGQRYASVKTIEQRIAKELRRLKSVPWLDDVAFGGCPACATCPANSANRPGLFVDVNDQPPTCLQPKCFQKKTTTVERLITKAVDRVRPLMKGKDKIELVPAALAKYCPKSVKLPTFVRRCKAWIDPAKPTVKKKTGQPAATPYHDKPEQVAARAVEKASKAWHKTTSELVLPALEKKPLLILLLRLLADTPGLLGITRCWEGDKVLARRLKGKPYKDAIAEIERASQAKPTERTKQLEALVIDTLPDITSRGHTRNWTDLLSDHYQVPVPMAVDVAKALGVVLPDAPDLHAIQKAAFDRQTAKLAGDKSSQDGDAKAKKKKAARKKTAKKTTKKKAKA